MSTEDAILLMDKEVQGIEAKEESLLIDYNDPVVGSGFSLFYITFDGHLYMKACGNKRAFKMSFMIKG
jgi:hypothetical protein